MPGGGIAAGASTAAPGPSGALVNLNTATEEQLDTLPGRRARSPPRRSSSGAPPTAPSPRSTSCSRWTASATRRWPTWRPSSRCDRAGSTSARRCSAASPGWPRWPRSALRSGSSASPSAAAVAARRCTAGGVVARCSAGSPGWSPGAESRRSALLRAEAVHATPVEALARAAGLGRGARRGHLRPGAAPGPLRAATSSSGSRTETVVGRGQRHRVRAPVLVIADERWAAPRARLAAACCAVGSRQARTRDLAGVLSTRGPPEVLAPARAAAPGGRPAARLDPGGGRAPAGGSAHAGAGARRRGRRTDARASSPRPSGPPG